MKKNDVPTFSLSYISGFPRFIRRPDISLRKCKTDTTFETRGELSRPSFSPSRMETIPDKVPSFPSSRKGRKEKKKIEKPEDRKEACRKREKRISVTHVSERGRINDLLFTNSSPLPRSIAILANTLLEREREKEREINGYLKCSLNDDHTYLPSHKIKSARRRDWQSTRMDRGTNSCRLYSSQIFRDKQRGVGKVGKSSLECIYIDPSVEDNLKGQGFRFDLSIEGGGEGRETERERVGEEKNGEEKEKSYISRGITNASAGGT